MIDVLKYFAEKECFVKMYKWLIKQVEAEYAEKMQEVNKVKLSCLVFTHD